MSGLRGVFLDSLFLLGANLSVGTAPDLASLGTPITFSHSKPSSTRKLIRSRVMKSQHIIGSDELAKGPRSRRANLVARGVLVMRRSDSEMKRNAEIGLFTNSSSVALIAQALTGVQ
jgi:hypothetical protein